MKPSRPGVLLCVLLAAPALLRAQTLTPPAQEYVLHLQADSVAYTAQINLGAAFTMESWVFLEAASPFSVIMGKVNNPRSADPFHHYIIGFESNGRIPSFVQTTGQPGTFRRIVGTVEIPLYTWVHVAGVLDSGVMRLYVNGQQVASGASPGPPSGAAVPFALGAGLPDGKTTCCTLSGALREARVWSRALSSSELQTYAIQKLTGMESGLIADWPLSDGSGSTAQGIGTQGVALTLQGTAPWITIPLLESGPYWEIQDLPSLTSATYGVQTALFLNADHRPDILLAYTPYALDKPTAGPVLFLHNEGKRVFSPVKPAQPAMMVWPRNSTVADFDGDGYEDVVVADHGYDAPPFPGGITRIFMQRSGEMKDETDSRLPPGPAFTHDVCSGDVNRDGAPDLFFANNVLYLNDGKGHFAAANSLLPPIFFGTDFTPRFLSCQFIDVNRDGAPDLLLGSNSDGDSRNHDWLLLNDGRGTLRDATSQSLPPKRGGPNTWATLGFAAVDVNRDGWPDIVRNLQDHGANGHMTTMQLLINNRDGTFHDQDDAALNVFRTDGFFDKTYPIELNQDGWPDLVAEENGSGVRLYQNIGGRFEDRTETLSARGSRAHPADFDGDGRIDIALFNETRNRIAWGKNLWPATEVSPFVLSAAQALSTTSSGDGSLAVGYARIQPAIGTASPSGLAIFGFRANNVLVSEASVPASPALTSGRIYAEVGTTLNTGLAIANPNVSAITVSFVFSDAQGDVATGSLTIPAGGQIAKFLDQDPFNGPAGFQGAFSFTSSMPVAVVALRGLTNERGEFLMTTLPVINLSIAPSIGTQFLSHFADGSGWTTEVLLLNPTDAVLTGTVQFISDTGGQTGSSLTYAIPPRSSQKLATPGTSSALTSGSVRVIPAGGGLVPTPLVVFSYKPAGVTISETGVAASNGTAFRMYAAASGASGKPGSIQTGLSIANTSTTTATVTLTLTTLDGASAGPGATVTIPGSGHTAKFLEEFFPNLPNPFQGVLRISATGTGISVVGLRGRYNERSDFLISTTPPTVENNTAAATELFFPHLANGGGYTTQFVLLGGSGGSTGTIRFVSQSGQVFALTLR